LLASCQAVCSRHWDGLCCFAPCPSGGVSGGDRDLPPAGLITRGARELLGDRREAILAKLNALRQVLPFGQIYNYLRGPNWIASPGIVGLLCPLACRARGGGVGLDPCLGRDEAAVVEEVSAEGAGLDRRTSLRATT
jgi:hypothetical protein